MRRQLKLPAEPNPTSFGPPTTFIGPSSDELPLELCQPSEDSQHQPSMWGGGVAPLISQRPEARTRLANCIEDVE
jgi:hypothetical protein